MSTPSDELRELWSSCRTSRYLRRRYGFGISNATWEQNQRFLTGWSRIG